MSNTLKRIISGLTLAFLFVGIIYLGRYPFILTVGIFGGLLFDEILTNFIQLKRKHIRYKVIIALYIAIYLAAVAFGPKNPALAKFIIEFGVLTSIVWAILLFLPTKLLLKFKNLTIKVPEITLLLFGPSVLVVSMITTVKDWPFYLLAISFISFGMDTGAYFSGKKFGHHKLWEAVSPKKTVEGLIGGMIFAALITTVFWSITFKNFSFGLVILFAFLAACSQLGDLIQSRLKRIFNLKDSSSLIPGHGGVYDRIDGFLFVFPLFLAFLIPFVNRF